MDIREHERLSRSHCRCDVCGWAGPSGAFEIEIDPTTRDVVRTCLDRSACWSRLAESVQPVQDAAWEADDESIPW